MRSLRLWLSLLAFALAAAACDDGAAPLPGRELEAAPAPDFSLRDAAGQEVSLAQYRGRPVVLTFLYTDCPDVCPVIAQRIGQALERLGKDATKVAVLAVSVDPAGDTPEKARAFMAKHGLAGADRHFLLGEAGALEPVWLAYGVGTAPSTVGSSRPASGPPALGRIGHTDATFLIDRQGRNRTLLRGEATAEEIAGGLRTLLR
jgi:protein SCO1/2